MNDFYKFGKKVRLRISLFDDYNDEVFYKVEKSDNYMTNYRKNNFICDFKYLGTVDRLGHFVRINNSEFIKKNSFHRASGLLGQNFINYLNKKNKF